MVGLTLFARLLRWTAAEGKTDPAALICGPGPLEMQDAWIVGERILRLRVGLASGAARLQVYQAKGAALIRCGDAPIGAGEVNLLDFPLFSRFGPLLLVVTSAEGRIETTHLLPFPSLLRGGAHQAEASALASGANRLREVAALSASFLDALFSRRGPTLAISFAEGLEDMAELRSWIEGIMVPVPDRREEPGTLMLGPASIPTISALLLTAAGPHAPPIVPPFLVTDDVCRPLGHISFPPLATVGLDSVQPHGLCLPWIVGRGDPPEGDGLLPPCAIVTVTPPRDSAALLYHSGPTALPAYPAEPEPLTVILHGETSSRSHAMLEALAQQQGNRGFDMRVLTDMVVAGVEATPIGTAELAAVSGDVLLLDVATIPHDPSMIARLRSTAQAESVASVGCLFVASSTDKTPVLRPVGSGRFRLGAQGDMPPLMRDFADLLPCATYPVDAPDPALAFIPAAAWAKWGALLAPFQPESWRAFAEAAQASGYRHLVTSGVSALRPAGTEPPDRARLRPFDPAATSISIGRLVG